MIVPVPAERTCGICPRGKGVQGGRRLPPSTGLRPFLAGAVAWVAMPPRAPLQELRKRLLTSSMNAVPHEASFFSTHAVIAFSTPCRSPHHQATSQNELPPQPLAHHASASETAAEQECRSGINACADRDCIDYLPDGRHNRGASEARDTSASRSPCTWTIEPFAFWRDIGMYVLSVLCILVRASAPHGCLSTCVGMAQNVNGRTVAVWNKALLGSTCTVANLAFHTTVIEGLRIERVHRACALSCLPTPLRWLHFSRCGSATPMALPRLAYDSATPVAIL